MGGELGGWAVASCSPLSWISQQTGGQFSCALPLARRAKRLHERGQAEGVAEGYRKEGEGVGLILLFMLIVLLVYLNVLIEEKNSGCEEDDDEV